MIWPRMLEGLPRAGEFSKPQYYKQNVQKMKGFLKKWVLTGKQVEDFRQNIQKFHTSLGEQNKGTTRPQDRKLNMGHVATKKLTEAKLKKKAFRINDAGRATTCRRNFKAPWLQTERTKNVKPTEKMSFNGQTVWKVQTKKTKNPDIDWRTKQKNHETPKAKTEHESCSQEELNWSKIEKSFHKKTVGNLQD